eukprot:364745-Chlamydomonas_euryale.AAC.7
MLWGGAFGGFGGGGVGSGVARRWAEELLIREERVGRVWGGWCWKSWQWCCQEMGCGAADKGGAGQARRSGSGAFGEVDVGRVGSGVARRWAVELLIREERVRRVRRLAACAVKRQTGPAYAPAACAVKGRTGQARAPAACAGKGGAGPAYVLVACARNGQVTTRMTGSKWPGGRVGRGRVAAPRLQQRPEQCG